MSIHQKALLVSLQIGNVPQTKKIKPASDRLEIDHHVAPNQAAVISRLFAKEDVKGLQQAAGAARNRFKELTLPFGRGQGLIPTARYFDFLEEMTKLKNTFESEKEYILDNIQKVLRNAADVNGALYDAANYPSLGDLRDAIYFSIEVNPVPSATAFDELANLSKDEIEVLKKEAVLNAQDRTEVAMKDLFGRLLKTLKHTADRLTDEETGERKIFHDTLVTNIQKAVTAAETLNLSEDENLKQLTEAVKEIIDGLSANDLRKDSELRKETAAKAAELASRIEDLF